MPNLPGIDAINNAPRDDFEGLSPVQMNRLLYNFLGPASPVKVKENLTEADLEAIPLLYFIRRLMKSLSDKEIKFTPKGNLPGKLVKEYYATVRLPDEFVETGITRIRGEDDYEPAQLTKHLPILTGWAKKRNGKLSLTKKGRAALELPPATFFEEVFFTHARKFNTAYFHGFEGGDRLQFFFPYLVYLLLHRGHYERRRRARNRPPS